MESVNRSLLVCWLAALIIGLPCKVDSSSSRPTEIIECLRNSHLRGNDGRECRDMFSDKSWDPRLSLPMGLADNIDMLAGHQMDFSHSEGNTLPWVQLPWGMTGWVPMTQTDTQWLARDRWGEWWFEPASRDFIGLRCAKQPSPWIGDHSAFIIQPEIVMSTSEPALQPHEWASQHFTTWRPYYFSTILAQRQNGHDVGGIRLELTPTNHGSLVRLTFPPSSSTNFIRRLRLDGIPGDKSRNSASWRASGDEIMGTISLGSNRPPHFKHYITASCISCKLGDGGSCSTKVDVTSGSFGVIAVDKVPQYQSVQVIILIGTSFISHIQASDGVKTDLMSNFDFDHAVQLGAETWNKLLGRVALHHHPLGPVGNRAFYTNMYRSMLFPRFYTEYGEDRNPIHASPFTSSSSIRQGELVTDSGFWDTYRSLYPWLTLTFPDILGRMMSGIINSGKEFNGIVPQWPAPGYGFEMVGSMGVASLADAVVKNITGFDGEEAYQIIVKDAFVPGDGKGRGRGCLTSNGYSMNSCQIKEKTATLLGYLLTDAAEAGACETLGHTDKAAILAQRSKEYKTLFQSSTKQFEGSRGSFTEGTADHYRFYVPHDVPGLVELYGGHSEFCQVMTQHFKGSPSGTVWPQASPSPERLGAIWSSADAGLSNHGNQPVFHQTWVAWRAGCNEIASKIQRRLVLRDRAWAGDEDNGAAASWQLLTTGGLYFLELGTDKVLVGAPIADFSILVPGSKKHLQIRRKICDGWVVTWNGIPVNDRQVAFSQLRVGGVLEVCVPPFEQQPPGGP